MEKITNSSIGERLKSVRQKMGWSQKQIAEALSISTNYWSALERGVKQPSIQLVRRIAELTGIDFEWIENDADLNVTRATPKNTPASESPWIISFNTTNLGEHGQFIDTLRRAFSKYCHFSEPRYSRDFFTRASDFDMPGYWIHIHDEPIQYWCFDMCTARPDPVTGADSHPPKYDYVSSYARFLTHALLLKECYRHTTKYSFVVSQKRFFDAFPQFSFPLGNLSLILLDPIEKRVLKERYICRVGDDELMASLDRLHFEEPNEQIKILNKEENEALIM